VVTAELIETRTGRLVWSETFDRKLDDLFAVLDEIGDCIVSSIAAEIETAERNWRDPEAAMLAQWPGKAYHRGLWHMYRFTKEENAAARHFFALAVKLDPTFARAPWPAFPSTIGKAPSRTGSTAPRRSIWLTTTAGQSLMVDDRDPVAHWAMGRALWLRGRPDDSLIEPPGCRRSQPELRARALCSVIRALPVGRSQGGDRRLGSLAAPQSVRSAAVRDAGNAGHGAGPPRPIRRGPRIGR